MNQIRGRIIGFLDKHTAVIDKGANDGVKLRDYVIVYENSPKTNIMEMKTENTTRGAKKILCVISVQSRISQVTLLIERYASKNFFHPTSHFSIASYSNNISYDSDYEMFNSETDELRLGDSFVLSGDTTPVKLLV